MTSTIQENQGMRSIAHEARSASLIFEAVFSFTVKAAKRLVQLPPSELETLKKLFVAFLNADDSEKPEILETMLEMVLPDERIGGVSEPSGVANESVRAKVDSARRYIGDQIRKHREAKRLTQSQLARKAKIPQSHVSRLERGRHAPSHLTIERVAAALAVEPAQLDPGYNGKR